MNYKQKYWSINPVFFTYKCYFVKVSQLAFPAFIWTWLALQALLLLYLHSQAWHVISFVHTDLLSSETLVNPALALSTYEEQKVWDYYKHN